MVVGIYIVYSALDELGLGVTYGTKTYCALIPVILPLCLPVDAPENVQLNVADVRSTRRNRSLRSHDVIPNMIAIARPRIICIFVAFLFEFIPFDI